MFEYVGICHSGQTVELPQFCQWIGALELRRNAWDLVCQNKRRHTSNKSIVEALDKMGDPRLPV